MAKHQIKLLYIYCNKSSEKHDDVYINAQADGGVSLRYPYGGDDFLPVQEMSDNQYWYLGTNGEGIVLNFEYDLQVTIWDQDVTLDPNTATFIMNYDFTPGQPSTSQQATPYLYNTDGAIYQIGYQILS